MVTDSKQKGKIMKELRKLEGLTQQEVADELKVKKSTYCLYENGKREPSLEMLVKIANIFSCSIDLIVKSILKRKGENNG